MSNYKLDVNGKRYELNEDFREALEERAAREYSKNPRFSCWWSVDDGDPILTIETHGVMVPWERLDQLEADMPEEPDGEDIFGRTHFSLTPHRYEEMPSPGGDDPSKIPPKPERVDDEMLVLWVPRHPEVTHTWGAGEAITAMDSWVEWNVQKRANQPQPWRDKKNSHDSFESMCMLYDCEQIGEYSPTNSIPEGKSGSVERKGEESFENGRFGGENWGV